MNLTPVQSNDTSTEAEARLASLFANLVLQHTELAMLLLGRGPQAEGEPSIFDLAHAQLVIDQLEMLAAKTRGNLSPPEAALLKQSLMRLRMTFVEAVDRPPAHSAAVPPPTAEPTPPPASPAPEAVAEDNSRKRFTKKY